ncbi:MAG TPA: DNA polymerase IV [Solirubrobacteraceae bacterium]|nr:DNA polymerase IV [Solirubrobacteraceae bacterium]
MSVRRIIAHLDCDAFYVSVELLRRPELVGKPVVVAGSGPRTVVTTASYEARRFGVGSASPAAQARRLCPQAIFVEPDFQSYRDKSREVWGLVRERLPVVSQVGLDEGYADATELEKPLRVLRELVAEVRDRTGITISVGVAPNRLIAKIASDLEKPQGFVAMGREEACRRLAGSGLRIIPGIGPKTAERLAAMGLTTIGALQRAGEQELAARFGARHARELLACAHFHGSDVVAAESGPAKSRSSETTFDTDIADPLELEAALGELAGQLCEGLQRKQVRGRTIAIKVRLDDWTTVTRARTLPAPVNDTTTVAEVALELLRTYAPPRPVRLLGVRLAAFEDEGEPEAAPERSPQLTLPLGRQRVVSTPP